LPYVRLQPHKRLAAVRPCSQGRGGTLRGHVLFLGMKKRLKWLRMNEWGSDAYPRGSAEAKRWDRAKIRFMMARANIRARGEDNEEEKR
jgi:hypothetical protein